MHNGAAHPVLLVEGETLVGVRRPLDVSVLVDRATLAVPVSCVEAGRWHDSGAMNRSRLPNSRELLPTLVGSAPKAPGDVSYHTARVVVPLRVRVSWSSGPASC